MKKAFAIVLLAALVLASVFAGPFDGKSGVTQKDSLGLGINLGTNSGLAVRYGMGDFDLIADVNYNLNGGSFGGDVGAMYQVATVKLKGDMGTTKATFPVTVGGMVSLGIASDISLSVLGAGSIEYTFKKVPVTTYARLSAGIKVIPEIKPDFGFCLGGIWNF